MKKIFVVIITICVFLLVPVLILAEDAGKGSAVSRAVHEAQAQGLKGKELAAKAHEAAKERKAAKKAAKEAKKKDRVAKKEARKKAKEAAKEAKELAKETAKK